MGSTTASGRVGKELALPACLGKWLAAVVGANKQGEEHRQMDSLAVTLSDSEVLNQPKRAQIAYPDPKTHG